MKKILLSVIATGAFIIANAQPPSLKWAKAAQGNSTESGNAVVIDAAKNVHVVGYFTDTIDLDPGTPVLTASTKGGNDMFIQKLDTAGNLIWAHAIGGTGYDNASAVAVDGAGSVYIAGVFVGTVDFDPGPGTQVRNHAGWSDVFVLKLSDVPPVVTTPSTPSDFNALATC